MGELAEKGIGGEPRSRAQALAFYTKAAEAGSAEAKAALQRLNRTGLFFKHT